MQLINISSNTEKPDSKRIESGFFTAYYKSLPNCCSKITTLSLNWMQLCCQNIT